MRSYPSTAQTLPLSDQLPKPSQRCTGSPKAWLRLRKSGTVIAIGTVDVSAPAVRATVTELVSGKEAVDARLKQLSAK